MDQFIQKVLACSNILDNQNLIESFPILSVSYQNEKIRILVFRFSNHGIPNYAVLGMMKNDFLFERDTFLEWLQNIHDLILEYPNQDKKELLEKFQTSYYSKNFLFT